jgi:deazaflavin-dependent oxidoreductase (nitroreductase family)
VTPPSEPRTVRARRRAYQAFTRRHNRLLLRTDGRPSWVSPRIRVLVLDTTGRRSGRTRSVVLAFFPDSDGYVVLGSNFGQERPPGWWHNLEADPRATVRVGGRRVPVRARPLQDPERAEVLARALRRIRPWRRYVTTVQRPLPVVRLEPTPPGA